MKKSTFRKTLPIILLICNSHIKAANLDISGQWERDVRQSANMAETFTVENMRKQIMGKMRGGPFARLMKSMRRKPSASKRQEMRENMERMKTLLGKLGVGANLLHLEMFGNELKVKSDDQDLELNYQFDGRKRKVGPHSGKGFTIKAHWYKGMPRIEYHFDKAKVIVTYERSNNLLIQNVRFNKRTRMGEKGFDFKHVYQENSQRL